MNFLVRAPVPVPCGPRFESRKIEEIRMDLVWKTWRFYTDAYDRRESFHRKNGDRICSGLVTFRPYRVSAPAPGSHLGTRPPLMGTAGINVQTWCSGRDRLDTENQLM